MYLREADITAAVDAWLLSLFDPENLDGAVAALTAAQEPDGAIAARAEAAKRKVADCDSRLAWYRKALEKGEAEIRALGALSERCCRPWLVPPPSNERPSIAT